MTEVEKHQARIAYFNSKYWKIAHHWFRTDARTEIRDHKVLHLPRTLAGIPRKDSTKSTFKDKIRDESLRIESDGHVVNMRVPEPNSVGDLLVNGELPDEISLLGDTRSQPYSPVQAAMALVKFACSLCPKEELVNCRGAIEWVRGRLQAQFSAFPVLFAHTPGVFDERVSHAILLRRKEDGPEPHL